MGAAVRGEWGFIGIEWGNECVSDCEVVGVSESVCECEWSGVREHQG